MIAPKKIEFGDFQTPSELCREVTAFLKSFVIKPSVIVEPTCGLGSFLIAARDEFPNTRHIYGFEINPQYIAEAKNALAKESGQFCEIERKDFFETDWNDFFARISDEEILVIGNPPWVTNSALGTLGSDNLPKKSNFQGHRGFAAKTGKANFDISEWMLIKLVEALQRKRAVLAMLCKTMTARKTLRHAWTHGQNVGKASIHLIDANRHFDVSVDACLFVLQFNKRATEATAELFGGLSCEKKLSTIGLAGKQLVADVVAYKQLREIDGSSHYTWRSGAKHDASPVMEFKIMGGQLINSRGDVCEIEDTYLFPLMKSSDVANGRMTPERFVLLTQRKPSDETEAIESCAPRTWKYLSKNAAVLDGRRSSIYLKRARFSVFGIGEYTFAPWKVAVSGLYKNCRFVAVGPSHGKPVVLDDTCYSVPCGSEDEANFLCDLLNSEVCQRFLRSLVFLDSKRPITTDILNRIDVRQLSRLLGRDQEALKYLPEAQSFESSDRMLPFEREPKSPLKVDPNAKRKRYKITRKKPAHA